MLTTVTDNWGVTREYPSHAGEPLSWSPGLYFTAAEESADYPRLRAVVAAMAVHRPDQLCRERLDALKGSFDRVFGPAGRKYLAVLEGATPRPAVKSLTAG